MSMPDRSQACANLCGARVVERLRRPWIERRVTMTVEASSTQAAVPRPHVLRRVLVPGPLRTYYEPHLSVSDGVQPSSCAVAARWIFAIWSSILYGDAGKKRHFFVQAGSPTATSGGRKPAARHERGRTRPHLFDRSRRTLRNSSGPSMRRPFRPALSSDVALVSPSPSIASEASSFARIRGPR